MADTVVLDGGEVSLSLQFAAGETALHHMIDGGEQGTFQPLIPPAYSGATTVTPGAQRQVLETAGLVLPDNIIIEPVPSNYGLIIWDGSTLLVR